MTTQEKFQLATRLLAEKKLPATWIGRINPESDTPVDVQVSALYTEFQSIQTKTIDEAVESGRLVKNGQESDETRTEEEWAKLMNESGKYGMVDLGVKPDTNRPEIFPDKPQDQWTEEDWAKRMDAHNTPKNNHTIIIV